jgi:hypothetical protein
MGSQLKARAGAEGPRRAADGGQPELCVKLVEKPRSPLGVHARASWLWRLEPQHHAAWGGPRAGVRLAHAVGDPRCYGGLEELVEFCPRRASNSATRRVSASTMAVSSAMRASRGSISTMGRWVTSGVDLSSLTGAVICPCPLPTQASGILRHPRQPPCTGHEGLRRSWFGASHTLQPGERLRRIQ